ncbi:MAG: phage baseplate assembly protein V [Bacteroidota bacterium]
MSTEEFVTRNYSLLNNLIIWGKVMKTNYARDSGRVWVSLGAHYGEDEIIDLPWLRRRGGKDWEWWAPEVGEQVLILAPGGRVERAVIIGSLPYRGDKLTMIDQSARKFNRSQGGEAENNPNNESKKLLEASKHVIRYEDETQITYDKETHQLKAELKAGKIKSGEESPVPVSDNDQASSTPTGIAITASAKDKEETLDVEIRDKIKFFAAAQDNQERVELSIKEKGGNKIVLKMHPKNGIELRYNTLALRIDPNGLVNLNATQLTINTSNPIDLTGSKTLRLHATQKIEIDSGGDLEIKAAKSLKFSAGEKIILDADKNIEVNSGKQLLLNASDDFKIKTDKSAELIAKSQIQLASELDLKLHSKVGQINLAADLGTLKLSGLLLKASGKNVAIEPKVGFSGLKAIPNTGVIVPG